MAINAVLIDGRIHDPVARLWAQAERIRAYLADRRSDNDVAMAIKGAAALSSPRRSPAYGSTSWRWMIALLWSRREQRASITSLAWSRSSRTPRRPVRRPPPTPRKPAPRLIYLVTEDWYFISHRLPMARAARDAGFEVHVATRVDRHGTAIEAEGFHLHPISWRRGSLDPRDLIRVVREVRTLYRSLKPDLAHHVALPATVVGSLAAIGLPVACLNAMTGLGTMFISDTAKLRVTRAVLTQVLRRLLRRSRSAVLVQNDDDYAMIERLGVDRRRIALIPGSGVDTDAMMPSPEPPGAVTVAFVGRLVESKGIRTLVAAHQRLSQRGRDIRAVDCRPAGPGKSGLDSAAGDRSLEQATPMSAISASSRISRRSGPPRISRCCPPIARDCR